MTIITEKHKKWSLYNNLSKCGVLSVSENLEVFSLACIFCPLICTRLDEFSKHIKKQHGKEIEREYANKTVEQVHEKKELHDEQTDIVEEEQTPYKDIKMECISSFDFFQDEVALDETGVNFLPLIGDSKAAITTSADPFETVYIKQEDEPEINLVVTKQSREIESGVMNIQDSQSASRNYSNISKKSDNDDNSSGSDNDDMKVTIEADSCDDNDDDNFVSQSRLDLLRSENYELLSYILSFYAKNELLWDSNHLDFNKAKKKLHTLKALSLEVELNYKQSFSCKELRQIFLGLRSLYRKEILDANKKAKTHEEAALHSKLWCFEQMKFVYKQTVIQRSRKPAKIMPQLKLLELADIYKAHPQLWNWQMSECRKKSFRREYHLKFLENVNKQMLTNFTDNELQSHIRRLKKAYVADKRRRLNCNITEEEFKPSQPRIYEKMHFIDQHIGPFRCERCNQLINSHDQFVIHVAAHDGRNAFACTECGKDFNTFGNLEVHMRRHTGENPYKCPYCEKGFPSSTDLATHKRIHTGAKPYICDLCGMAFRSSTLLSHHQIRHDPTTYKYQCPHCPKKLCEKYLLREHINSHLQVREHICQTCGKGFFAMKTLRQHEQLHSEVTRYECNLCGKRFKQISAMYSHKKTHRLPNNVDLLNFAIVN